MADEQKCAGRELDYAGFLEALADRRDNAKYEPVMLEGYSTEQVASAAHRLWRAGYVDAYSGKPAE